MSKSYHAERHSGIATYKLPTALSREIGRVMVHWAYFEHCIQEMNWGAMNVTGEVGRIAAREPRATDRLEMLGDLIRLRGADMDWQLHKSILKRAEPALAMRDLLAHAIWTQHRQTKEWLIQKTKGKWPKELAELISGPRKIVPESLPMDAEKLKSIVSEIDSLIEDLKTFRASAAGPTST
jgi:hypothetical protein